MMKKVKFLSISFILIVGMIFLVQSCQKEAFIEEKPASKFNLKIITIDEFISNQKVAQSNELISKYYDINTENSSARSEVPVSNFVILTDKIVHVTTDSTETFSFQIKTPTVTSSTFENFVVEVRDSINSYFIFRFRQNNDESDFPYSNDRESLSVEDINLADFQDFLSPELPLPDGCYEIIECDCPDGWGLIIVDCPGGGGGGGTDGVGTGENTGDNLHDPTGGVDSNTGQEGGDYTGATGGAGSNTGGSSYSPVGVNRPTNAQLFLNHFLQPSVGDTYFSPEVMAWILANENNPVFKDLDQFLTENHDTPEALEFAALAVQAIVDGGEVDFNQFYSTQFINNIQNPATGAGVELYYMAIYNSSQVMNTSLYSIAVNEIEVGDYFLKPHYGLGDQLVFYLAYRLDTNNEPRWEYIVKANELNNFQENINHYTAAANLFFFNGIPSLAQIQMCAGDYWTGLGNMWNDAIHSPEWWIYAITSFGTAVATLPTATPVSSTATVPNWRVPLNRMTAETFQGKIVTNPQGTSITINIPDNYVASITNNGQGINFRPNPPINNVYNDAGLIRVMQPTTQNPTGYTVFYNNYGQPINPITNQTLSSANWHFRF